MNTAYQILTPQDKVQRFALCDASFKDGTPHAVRSTKMIGIQKSMIDDATYWVFRCKHGHNFIALADPHAPESPEDTQAWIEQAKLARVKVRGA